MTSEYERYDFWNREMAKTLRDFKANEAEVCEPAEEGLEAASVEEPIIAVN